MFCRILFLPCWVFKYALCVACLRRVAGDQDYQTETEALYGPRCPIGAPFITEPCPLWGLPVIPDGNIRFGIREPTSAETSQFGQAAAKLQDSKGLGCRVEKRKRGRVVRLIGGSE